MTNTTDTVSASKSDELPVFDLSLWASLKEDFDSLEEPFLKTAKGVNSSASVLRKGLRSLQKSLRLANKSSLVHSKKVSADRKAARDAKKQEKAASGAAAASLAKSTD